MNSVDTQIYRSVSNWYPDGAWGRFWRRVFNDVQMPVSARVVDGLIVSIENELIDSIESTQ